MDTEIAFPIFEHTDWTLAICANSITSALNARGGLVHTGSTFKITVFAISSDSIVVHSVIAATNRRILLAISSTRNAIISHLRTVIAFIKAGRTNC